MLTSCAFLVVAMSDKRKRVHLSIKDKLELLKKLDSGYSVAKVCSEYGVKKQTVSDIRRAREKLKVFSMKFDVINSNFDEGYKEAYESVW